LVLVAVSAALLGVTGCGKSLITVENATQIPEGLQLVPETITIQVPEIPIRLVGWSNGLESWFISAAVVGGFLVIIGLLWSLSRRL
jgi:hypothetical protein